MNFRNLALFTSASTLALLFPYVPKHQERTCACVQNQMAERGMLVPQSGTQPTTLLLADGSGPVPPPPTQSRADGSGPMPPPPTQHGAVLLADGSGPVPPPPTQPKVRLAGFPV